MVHIRLIVIYTKLCQNPLCTGFQFLPGSKMRFLFIVSYNALQYGIPWVKLWILGKIPDVKIPPKYNLSFIRLFYSCHNLQQGRFSCAVDSNQSNLFPFLHTESSVIKQQPLCIGFGQMFHCH